MTNARVMQVATSLNSALAEYDNKTVTATKYYNKTESDNNYPRFPDYSQRIEVSLLPSWTATEDCFLVYLVCPNRTETRFDLYINDVELSINDMISYTFFGYIKKGDVIRSGGYNGRYRIYKLR